MSYRMNLKWSEKLLMILFKSCLLTMILLFNQLKVDAQHLSPNQRVFCADAKHVTLSGFLNNFIVDGYNGRLNTLVVDEKSWPIAIFHPDSVAKETNIKNWRGEHAGKWLTAASKAAHRLDDKALENRVKQVADYLVARQEPNGYLGNYNPEIRFYKEVYPNKQTWDIWVNTYLITGLVEVYMNFPNEKYLNAARKIADLIITTFPDKNRDICNVARQHGMVSTGSIDPIMDLYFATNDKKYLEFAWWLVSQMEKRPGLHLLTKCINNDDVDNIGNGKIYEMLRNFTGLAKLYRATGDTKLIAALTNGWNNIQTYHLSPCGGPWGGNTGHKECFDPYYYFNPCGLNETCSNMEWIRFSTEMYKITGESKYMDEIEITIYNALIGAQYPGGNDWIYYNTSNGMKTLAANWACCPSSGMIALELLPSLVFSSKNSGIAVNLYNTSSWETVSHKRKIGISQSTKYPLDGKIKIFILGNSLTFPVYLRIPGWAKSYSVAVNGKPINCKTELGYAVLKRRWGKNDSIELDIPVSNRFVYQSSEYDEKGFYLNARTSYIALMRGPLAYATDFPKNAQDSILKVPANAETFFTAAATPSGLKGQAYNLSIDDSTFLFTPYFETGYRQEGTPRHAWMKIQETGR